MRRLLIAAMAAAISLLCLVGCQAGDAQKEKLTVYLWSVDLLSEYAPYVESQVPEADIEWVVGNNDLDFYKFYAENGELPDIITTRRFSVNDAASLQPYLMDLSSTEVAASFYTAYLENYRNADGSVNWLPACGEVDGLIANKELFDRYGIDLPTDYASFVAACRAFEEHGIRGYMSDFVYDYTCMETLQGASIAQLQSLEGRMWRLDYENGVTTGLDAEVWPGVFERFEAFVADTGLTAEDSKASYGDWREAFIDEKVAIVRGTGVDLGTMAADGLEDVVLLPYFGDIPEENWVLTYPSFQVAVSEGVEESDSRRDAALAVISTMLSEEGQNLVAPAHSAIPYNKNVELELAPELDCLIPYIESNRLYIRLASNEFFAVSQNVVGKMLSGEYDAAQAYEAFDALLREPEGEAEAVCAMECSYPYDTSAEGGNPAASALANTLRGMYGAELLIMPSYVCTGPILEGGYTEKALKFVTGPNTPCIFEIELKGSQVEALARMLVEGGEGAKVTPFSLETLPVASGIELEVAAEADGGYSFAGVTLNGEPLDAERTYKVAYVDNSGIAKTVCAAALGEDGVELPGFSAQARVAWVDHIMAGNEPAAPSNYITVR